MALEIIPQWKQAWKFAVVIGNAAIATASSIYAGVLIFKDEPGFPEVLTVLCIPPEKFALFMVAASTVVGALRIFKQRIAVPLEVKEAMIETVKTTPIIPTEVKS